MSDDNIVQFPMAPCPDLMSDTDIHALSELETILGGVRLNPETLLGNRPASAKFAERAETIPEHPLAAKLYRDFKAGSQIMTKTEAYKIGNELDSLLKQTLDLHAEMARKIAVARETVQQLLVQIEQLRQ